VSFFSIIENVKFSWSTYREFSFGILLCGSFTIQV